MFDIGFWELLLIALVGLLVIGPERLPAVARTVGLWTGRIRTTAARFRADLEHEFRAQELRRVLEEEAEQLRRPFEEAAEAIEPDAQQLTDAARDLEARGRAAVDAVTPGARRHGDEQQQ